MEALVGLRNIQILLEWLPYVSTALGFAIIIVVWRLWSD